MKEFYWFIRDLGIDLALILTGLIGGTMMLSKTKIKLSQSLINFFNLYVLIVLVEVTLVELIVLQ